MTDIDNIKEYCRNKSISEEDLAKATGRSVGHIKNLFYGYFPLSDGMRFRLLQAYPGLKWVLLEDTPTQPESATQ